MGTLGKIDKLKINGYKSIKSIEIEFLAINILIGANGVGKSNFIGFFNFIRKLVEKELGLYVSQLGGANKILHFGKKMTKELNFSLLFKPNGYQATLLPDNTDGFIFKSETGYFFANMIGYGGDTKQYPLDNAGGRESKLPNYAHTSSPLGHIVGYIKDWKVYHFHDTSKESAMKQSCNINDYYSLAVDGGNLPAFLYYIKNNYEISYSKIIKTIQRVAPFFHDFILEPDIANNEIIKLRWKHKGSDLYFDANDFSDGTIRFICLVTLLLQPKLPTLILLDEPELGLHPFALEILASLFRVASNKTQIIASTQSATFADFFDIENIIVADTKDNTTTFNRLDVEKYKNWIEEYSVGELWQKNLIGGVPTYD
ncbi:MAG: AAA family ATPase [Sulfurimonas sp.]|jgi:predicted ATPase